MYLETRIIFRNNCISCQPWIAMNIIWYNKSDVTRRNTLGYLDQEICAEGWDWNSRDCEAVYVDKHVQRMGTEKQAGPWSGLGKRNSHVYYVFSQVAVYYYSGRIIDRTES